jgi:hypothetical protein
VKSGKNKTTTTARKAKINLGLFCFSSHHLGGENTWGASGPCHILVKISSLLFFYLARNFYIYINKQTEYVTFKTFSRSPYGWVLLPD